MTGAGAGNAKKRGTTGACSHDSTNLESRGFLTPRIVIGLLVVAFGLALLLDNLGWMDAGEIIRYWPFGVIVIGVG